MKIKILKPVRTNTFVPPHLPASKEESKVSELLPEELLQAIQGLSLEVPSSIKDIVDLAQRTTHLSINHRTEETEAGPMYLLFLPPYSIDFFGDSVVLEKESTLNFYSYIANFGGYLWIVLPPGKRFMLTITAASKRKNSVFHIGVRYQDHSQEYMVDSTGETQIFSFVVDTHSGNLHHIDVANFRSRLENATHHVEWTFYKCTVVDLD